MAADPQANPDKNIVLIAFVMVLAGLGLSYQFLVPSLQSAKQAKEDKQVELEGLTADLASLQRVGEQLDAGKRAMASRGVDLDQVGNVVPGTEQMPQLYLQLEYLMQQAPSLRPTYTLGNPVAEQPTTVDPMTGLPVTAADTGVKIPVTVTATGSYAELKGFVERLQFNIRPLVFAAISFSQATATGTGAATITLPAGTLTLNATGFVRAQGVSSAYETKAN